jgi:hypothetical protein
MKEMRVASIALALPTPGVVGMQDTSSRPYGIVSYGSDGAITKVKFDIGLGTRFTVTGSYVCGAQRGRDVIPITQPVQPA